MGSITEKCDLIVIKNSNYNLILGLDLINKFKLKLLENYTIFQTFEINNKIFNEKIITNYSNSEQKSQTIFDNKNLNELKINLSEISLEKSLNNDIKPNKGLSIHKKEKLDKLLNQYSNIFLKDKYDIGSVDIEECKIDLKHNIPINLRPYRCSLSDQKIIDNQIKILLERGLIRKSTSSYAFPITLVDKKDEGKKSRLTIDFRKLNELCIHDNQPFPRIDDIIDKLYDSKYFSVIDISNGFWHVKVYSKDVHKTAFVTMNEHYEWLVLPFGYRNSPMIFQRIIRTVLKKHNLLNFSDNYLDDIMIHSKTFDEHLLHIEKVLKALISENIKLKLSKCSFAQKTVKYLGHIISKNKIKPLNDNLISIKEFPTPKNVKNIQQFLGKVNYYHRFIPNTTKFLNPLYILLQKDNKFLWNDECQKSFDSIKTYLTSAPILAIYNPKKNVFYSLTHQK